MDRPRLRTPERRRRLALATAAAALLVASAALGVSRLGGAPPEMDRAAAWIGTVERGPMAIEVRAPGRLVPEIERWVAAPAAGVVERILVAPGHALAAGDPVLTLSNPVLERERLDAELTVRAEEAGLAALAARLDGDALDLRATLAQIESQLQDAELTLRAQEQLAGDGLVSSIELQRSGFRVEELRRRHAIELERVERRRSARSVELDAQRARVARGRALADDLGRQVESLIVRVAAAGIVAEVLAEPGTRTVLGERLARVIDPSRLIARLDVPQARAAEIRVGLEATIDVLGATVTGLVQRVDPAVREGVVRVDVTAEAALPADARDALRVDGTIVIERLGEVLNARRPMNAREGATLEMFRLIDDDLAESVPVELGRVSVNTIQIVAGLEAGDRIILSDTSDHAGAPRLRLR